MSEDYKREKGGSGWDKIPERKESKRLSDIFQMFELNKKGKWSTGRLIGGISSVAMVWVEIVVPKRGTISIPKICLNWDSTNHSFDSTKTCPYYDALQAGKLKNARLQIKYLANIIDRNKQEEIGDEWSEKWTKSEKKSGFKDIESNSKTPVCVFEIPSSLAKKVKSLTDVNKAKNKKTGETKTYPMSHEKYGCDILLRKDPDGQGTDQYQVQKDERTPLTEDELKYLVWPIDKWQELLGMEDLATAKSELKALIAKAPEGEEGDDDEEDDDDEQKSKSKSKGKGKGKAKYDEDDEEDEDEDEPKSKSKSKAKGKSKAKSKDEDDEEDDDLDLDDEDEEEEDEPKSKSKSKGKAKGKSKSKDEDDEDEEDDLDLDDDEEDDDEEEAPKSKSKSKGKGKAKPKDDDDEEDDDEEEEEAPKSKSKAKGKSKPKDEDEDEEEDEEEDDDDFDLDDDDEEDEDEEEEEAPKSKSKAKGKGKGKK